MATPNPSPNKPGLKITSAERPNTLGLSQRDLSLVLDKLEGAEKGKAPVRRGFARWPFRHATVWVTLEQPSGGEVRLKLACRNLSRGGISLLHNSFVHPGSTVMVVLPRLQGGSKDVAGTVRRCQHRRGALHELGVQFSEEIDLHEFMGPASTGDIFSLENVNAEKLTGTAVYVGDNETDFRTVQHFLRESQLRLVQVKTGEEGVTEASKGCDIIIANPRATDMKGTDIAQRLRDQGIMTPVVIIAAAGEHVSTAGTAAVDVLVKPLQQMALLRVIAERMLVTKPEDGQGHGADQAVGGVSGQVVMRFQAIADTMEKALSTNDTMALVEACMQVRGSAPALGLTALSTVAETAINALTSGDVGKRNAAVRELASACRSLTAAA